MKAIKPIRNERDYLAALAEIDLLVDSEPDTADHDRCEILTVLVEAYEECKHPVYTDDIGPIEAIKFWLEQNALSNSDLESYLGSRARVSEILNGKRQLSITMIRKLVTAGIPAELLIRPLHASKAA